MAAAEGVALAEDGPPSISAAMEPEARSLPYPDRCTDGQISTRLAANVVAVRWMWADAGLVTSVAALNPIRWSRIHTVEDMIVQLEAYLQTPSVTRPLKLEVTGWPLEAKAPIVMTVADVTKALVFFENLAAGNRGPAREHAERTTAELVTFAGPSSVAPKLQAIASSLGPMKTAGAISTFATKLVNDASLSATRSTAAVRGAAATVVRTFSEATFTTTTMLPEPATEGTSTAFPSTASVGDPAAYISSRAITVADLNGLSAPCSSSSLTCNQPFNSSQTLEVGSEYIAALEAQIKSQEQHIFTLQEQLQPPPSNLSVQQEHVGIRVVAVQPTGLGSFENSTISAISNDALDVSRRLGSQPLNCAGPQSGGSSAQDSVTLNVAVATTEQLLLPRNILRTPHDNVFHVASEKAAHPRGDMGSPKFGSTDATIVPTQYFEHFGPFAAGDCVEYFSSSAGTWISAKVLGVTQRGTFNLDCKPDVLPKLIRRVIPRIGVTFSAGDAIQYYSTTCGGWVPAKVLRVCPNGNFDLDCKTDVPAARMRCSTGRANSLP